MRRIWVGLFIGCSLVPSASLAAPGSGGGSAATGATAATATSAAATAAARVLDKPAFTATPGELLALGKDAPSPIALAGAGAEAVAQSEAILALRPDSIVGRGQIHAWVLARSGRFEDADRELDRILAKDPDHHAARIGRFEVAAIRGAAAEAISRSNAVIQHPGVMAWELNYVAWYRLGLRHRPARRRSDRG